MNLKGKHLYLRHVSEEFVLKKLNLLNPYKSIGLGEILARFLKEGAFFLNIPVTFLVNLSISDNCVVIWKLETTDSVVFKNLEKNIYIQLEA